MSLSTSTEQLSLENEHNLEDKNMPSPTLSFDRQNQSLPPQLSLKTPVKSQNYQNKNGSLKFKIKSENKSEAYSGPQQMRYDSFSTENSIKSNQPFNFRNLFGDSNYLSAKQLEFETSNCQVSPPFLPLQPFAYFPNYYLGNYFQEKNLFPSGNILSKIFSKSLDNFNNFYLPKAYPNLLNIPKEVFFLREKTPKKLKEREKKSIKPQEKIEPNELIKLSFQIPDDFLIKFQIKEIEVIPKQLSQYIHDVPKFKKILLKDMELYINNLCKKVSSRDVFLSKIHFGEEYIDFEVSQKEENLCSFLQKKRKLSKDQSEKGSKTKYGNDPNDACRRRHPLKKKYKKINKKLTVKLKNLIKLNNKKNGAYISVNLNQIQINKIGLAHFPFHPLINSKEINKISFLKGIVERKDLIRINKKVSLVKDLNDHKNLFDKEYKIIYQSLMENAKYVVHISGINILHLILYYYYQIHKGIEQINTYHYSHSAFYKSLNEINKIEEIIKKCNLIVKEISKEV